MQSLKFESVDEQENEQEHEKASSVTPSTRGWVRCGRHEILLYEVACYALGALSVLFLVLFAYYAHRLGNLTSCRLTYSATGIISESEMHTWAVHNDWKLDVPRYSAEYRTCVCPDAGIYPTSLEASNDILVWIAPGDLVSLYEDGYIQKLPADFVNNYRGMYGENDHVKVCLRHDNLVALWGVDYQTLHCHEAGHLDGTVSRFYLGFDGALYCAQPKLCSSYKNGDKSYMTESHVFDLGKKGKCTTTSSSGFACNTKNVGSGGYVTVVMDETKEELACPDGYCPLCSKTQKYLSCVSYDPLQCSNAPDYGVIQPCPWPYNPVYFAQTGVCEYGH